MSTWTWLVKFTNSNTTWNRTAEWKYYKTKWISWTKGVWDILTANPAPSKKGVGGVLCSPNVSLATFKVLSVVLVSIISTNSVEEDNARNQPTVSVVYRAETVVGARLTANVIREVLTPTNKTYCVPTPTPTGSTSPALNPPRIYVRQCCSLREPRD